MNENSRYFIEQVGKRWFIVRRVIRIGDRVFEAFRCEATYSMSDWDDKQNCWNKNRKWTLTGKGSRAYRESIVKVLEDHLKEAVSHE